MVYRHMNLLQLAHHWLIPHESNNHRSKALHLESLLGYVLMLMVVNFGIRYVHVAVPDILGYATDIRIEQLLASTNAKRQEQGLSSLELNTTLSTAAAAKASDMFANNYWAHNSPSGKTPWDFINAAGYTYTLAGENLAKNFQTSDGVVNAWMESPSHRENVLKPGYHDVGFAIVNGTLNGEETTLVVQMFGTTKNTPVAAIPQVQAQAPAPVLGDTQVKTIVSQEPLAQISTAPVPPEVPIAIIPTPAPAFLSVSMSPKINISSLSKQIVFVFVGMLLGVLAIDGYVVSRRKVVRLAGHNAAHILFLLSIIVGGLFLTHGSLV